MSDDTKLIRNANTLVASRMGLMFEIAKDAAGANEQQNDIEDDLNAIRCAMGNLADNVGHMTREQWFRFSQMFIEYIKLIMRGKNDEE